MLDNSFVVLGCVYLSSEALDASASVCGARISEDEKPHLVIFQNYYLITLICDRLGFLLIFVSSGETGMFY